MNWLLPIFALCLCGCQQVANLDAEAEGRFGDVKPGIFVPGFYEHPSASAPESLKPYYDPDLTKALNR